MTKGIWNPEMECMRRPDLEALQLERLRALVDYCDRHVEFYHKRLSEAGVTADRVETLYTAGGFGSRLGGRNAAAIGLIPSALTSRIEPTGNAALDGAALLLLNEKARQAITALAQKIRVIELATDPYFTDLFIKNMSF